MGANSEVLEPIAVPASGRLAQRQRDQEELLDFALREATSEWFYDLELNGAEIEGIGIQGAVELSAFRAEQGYPIRFANAGELIEVERNSEIGVQATIIVREARTFREGIGVAFFPYFMAVQEGDEAKLLRDTRADRKALSIAKRNAILDLIPDEVKRTLLAERRRVVPINEERKAREINAARIRTVPVPAVRTSAASEQGPYDEPSRIASTMRRGPAPATSRQVIRLVKLIEHPSVSDVVRATVNSKLESGLSEAMAAEWIPILEAQTKELV